MAAAKAPEARKVLRELDRELADAGRSKGVTLVWSAAEAAILAQIASVLDRKADFLEMYEAADSVSDRLKLSAEVRLLEGLSARLVRLVRTDLALPESRTTVKARHAAEQRWRRAQG